MKVEPKRPNYTTIYCLGCDLPNHQCTCEPQDEWSRIDDEALDDPRHGQAKDINRKWER